MFHDTLWKFSACKVQNYFQTRRKPWTVKRMHPWCGNYFKDEGEKSLNLTTALSKKKQKNKKKTAFSMKSWLQNLILLIQNIIPWLHATLYLYFSYFFKVWNASLINFFFPNSARLGTTKCLHATSGHFYICPLSDVTSNFSCVEPWPINLRYFGTTKVRAILSNDILSHLNNHCHLIFCSFIPCQLYNRNILSTRGFW